MCRMVTSVSTSVLYPGNWLREWISGVLDVCKSGGGERENQVQKISATIQKYVLNI